RMPWRQIADATGLLGILYFIFVAGTFPSFWLQHSVRGFSCSLLTVPRSLCTTLCFSTNSSTNQNLSD
ncbi:MAG: hypothetical protein IKF98_05255, partial [Clostridia bacterium]|nr:hypothetical protein [Clostridia bacterium]